MKKNYTTKLILFLITLFSLPSFAQKELRNPLSDAINYEKGDSIKKYEILKAYSKSLTVLNNNNFIKVPSTSWPKDSIKVAEISNSQGFDGNALGAPLIDALGTVIAKRFKEELTLAFLESFREKLKAELYLGALFPNSKNILLNGDPFNHKVWLTSFRGALDEDLKVLPDSIPVLLEEIKKNLSEDQIIVLDAVIEAYRPALVLAKNPEKSYSSIVEIMKNIKDVDFKNKDLTASLTFSYLLVKEMGNSRYDDWANKNALKNLENINIATTFIGFTIEKYADKFKKIEIKGEIKGDEKTLYALFHSSKFKNKTDFVLYLNSITSQVSSISETINILKKKSTLNFTDYLPLINQSIDAISILMDGTTSTLINSKYEQPDGFTTYLKSTKLSIKFASKLNANLSSKEYAKVIVNTLAFIREFVDQDKLNKSTELKEFIKYSNLAINLAGATTSEEMVAAIEGAALPSQSYRLKRNSYFSVSLNSYAGIFIANEYLINNEAKNEIVGVVGFTAPIGIGLNWGLVKDKTSKYSNYNVRTGKDKKGNKEKAKYFVGHSLSLFASIVDVGAITTFRLTNDETPVTDIQWQNIFAPGAYFVWGIGNTPMALMVGGQYGPELRNVTAADGVATPTITSSAWRFGVSLTVDIPLLHFYAKTEKFKDKFKDKSKRK